MFFNNRYPTYKLITLFYIIVCKCRFRTTRVHIITITLLLEAIKSLDSSGRSLVHRKRVFPRWNARVVQPAAAREFESCEFCIFKTWLIGYTRRTHYAHSWRGALHFFGNCANAYAVKNLYYNYWKSIAFSINTKLIVPYILCIVRSAKFKCLRDCIYRA